MQNKPERREKREKKNTTNSVPFLTIQHPDIRELQLSTHSLLPTGGQSLLVRYAGSHSQAAWSRLATSPISAITSISFSNSICNLASSSPCLCIDACTPSGPSL